MFNLKINLLIILALLFLTSCEKDTFQAIEAQSITDNSLKNKTQEEQPILDLLLKLYEKNNGSFEIIDRRINPEIINRFLVAIGEEPIDNLTNGSDQTATLGKKRCTKWKNGKRFCVQRKGFLHWKFGTEHCGGGSEC